MYNFANESRQQNWRKLSPDENFWLYSVKEGENVYNTVCKCIRGT